MPGTNPFGAPLVRADWCLRLAGPADMPAIMALRARAFGHDQGDEHDAGSLHFHLGLNHPGAPPLATARLSVHREGAALLAGYSGQRYDLTALAGQGGITLELGRLCTEPGQGSGAMLRMLWAGAGRVALRTGAARLVGCTSFAGTDPEPLAPALAYLAAHHLGPKGLRPGIASTEVHRLPLGKGDGDAHALPTLLRAYLAMGGWVGDHLVIDHDLGTCHIFTCVEVAAMPAARQRAFRRLAGL